MKNLIILLLIVIASGLLPEHCAAKGRTDSLADRADAVVVGEIQSAQQMGSSVSLALLVVRSLKGSLTAGSIVTVPTHSVGQAQAKGNLAGQYGIWFLRQTGGQWTFIPKDGFSGSGWATTYLPLPKTGLPANVHTSSVPATVGDMIAVEITAALLSDPTHAHLSGPDSMYWGLREVETSPVVHELYELLHSNANLELKFIGLAGLLGGGGGTTALKEIADNMDLIPKLRSDVATTICGVRNIDPAAVQSLGKIATSPNQTLQRCAAVALKAIHTRDTLPLLAQLVRQH